MIRLVAGSNANITNQRSEFRSVGVIIKYGVGGGYSNGQIGQAGYAASKGRWVCSLTV